MSIDTTRAPEGVKTGANANTNTQRAGNNAARNDKSAATSGQGFANLMNLLTASEVPAEPAGSTLALTDATTLPGQPTATTNLAADPSATSTPADPNAAAEAAAALLLATTPLTAPPAVALSAAPTLPVQTAQPELPLPDAALNLSATPALLQPALPATDPLQTAAQASAEADLTAADPAGTGLPLALPLPVLPVPADVVPPAAAAAGLATAGEAVSKQAADTLAAARARLADKPDMLSATVAADAPALSDTSAAHDVAALLDHRRAMQTQAQTPTQSQGLGRMQAELRDARLQAAALQPTSVADASRAALTLSSPDALARPTERQAGRPLAGQVGGGFDGLLGSALTDKLGISPTYEVTAASAVVPETQLAETVSYWATHGVQSAELTLEGLGTEPVEVRISVDGDQTQIDFRSNQAEVRQVLESASAQLKALLSGEGLQLSGMSVGTSGRGNTQGDGRQPRPGARQVAMPSLEPLSAGSARSANPAVGRGLDLYV